MYGVSSVDVSMLCEGKACHWILSLTYENVSKLVLVTQNTD